MKDVVSFPVAKLVVEKGISIGSKFCYEFALKSKKHKNDGYSGPFGWKKGELNLQEGYHINDRNKENKYWLVAEAPTVWKLHQFIQEHYKLHIRTGWVPFEQGRFWEYSISDYDKTIAWGSGTAESELECFNEAFIDVLTNYEKI